MDLSYSFILQYRRNGLLIDTNILLLYFIGSYDRNLITKFKATKDRFSIADFDILVEFISHFNKLFTTPNILTEVNSLSNLMYNKVLSNYLVSLKRHISILEEKYADSKHVSQHKQFTSLGLTDTAIVLLGKKHKFLCLTDDHKLNLILTDLNIPVLNFNYIRDFS